QKQESTPSAKSEIEPIKMKTISKTKTEHSTKENASGVLGVFDEVRDAIDAAYEAQRKYVKEFQLKDREKIIQAIRNVVLENKEDLARRVYEETKLGRYEDKIAKHELVALKTPGTEDLKTIAYSGDDGLTIVEAGPYGLIGAVTPVTNPTETIINNSIGMLASGN